MTQQSIAVSTTPPLPGLSMVQQVNGALQTVATNFAGDSDPAAFAGPFMTWADTQNGLLKRRNPAGSAWIVEGSLLQRAIASYPNDAIPSQDIGQILVDGVGRMTFYQGAYAPDMLPPRYRGYPAMSVSGNSFSIAAGAWRAADGAVDIRLDATLQKSLQSSGGWAAGNNQNGLFTGARAPSSWYHVFVIRRDSDGAVDVGFDTSIAAANRPSGWTAYRRVWSLLTDASGNLRTFFQAGADCIWSDRISVANGLNVTGADQLISIPVPAGFASLAHVSLSAQPVGSSTAVTVCTPGMSIVTGSNALYDIIAATTYTSVNSKQILTNTAGQVLVRSNVAQSNFLAVAGIGYRDPQGD